MTDAIVLAALEFLRSLVEHYGDSATLTDVMRDLEAQPSVIAAIRARRDRIDQELHDRFDTKGER